MDSTTATEKDVTLLEVLDRVLDKGVVVAGDLVISVADVDLIYVGLKVLLSSVETMERLRGMGPPTQNFALGNSSLPAGALRESIE
jgi:gas vesicle structural protein